MPGRVASCFRRGVLAGALAGLAAGLLSLLVAEPQVERALAFEQLAGTPSVEVFSRTVQRAGLVGGVTIYGIAVGGLFGLWWPLLAPRLGGSSPGRQSVYRRSVCLALAAFGVLWLVPFFKYPANPPGVGDPATIARRTASYLAMVGWSVVAALGARAGARVLWKRGVKGAWAVGGLAYAAAVAAAYLTLPPGPAAAAVPAGVVWRMRVASVATQAAVWLVLGVVFGGLALRDERGCGEGPASLAELGPRFPE